MTDQDDVLMRVSASPMRRWLAVVCLAGLGILLTSLVFEPAPAFWRIGFLVAAILAFLVADRLRRATQDVIELTRDGLRTASGRQLAHIDNIKSVERGAFAFKPSNGFLIRLHEPEENGWAPGLWWKRGRLLGIGGVISGGQSRAMAEILVAVQQGIAPNP